MARDRTPSSDRTGTIVTVTMVLLSLLGIVTVFHQTLLALWFAR